VTETLELLEAVAEGKFSFVPAELAKRAQASVLRGIDCIIENADYRKRKAHGVGSAA